MTKKGSGHFAKTDSMRFSQDPCFGVNTKWNRFGFVFKKARVSFEIWAEWLSKIILMIGSEH
jgi:hypothetical protein